MLPMSASASNSTGTLIYFLDEIYVLEPHVAPGSASIVASKQDVRILVGSLGLVRRNSLSGLRWSILATDPQPLSIPD